MQMSSVPESKVPVMPPRILLGPGPSNTSPRVLQAMMSPMIGYADPEFMVVLDEVSELLRLVFQTEDGLAIALPGTGSAGMQAGLNSLLEPGDTVVICSCGYFGERMADMAERLGANAVVLRGEWGRPFPPEMLEEELGKHESVKMVSVVHAETSTGVLQPLDEIAKLARASGALLMVDAVTSLGGSELNFDALGIDYAYSCSQKCLGAPPGICPVAVGPRALEVIESRTTKPPSWYLDLGLIAKYWGPEHVYHHTAPVSMILGLREALRIVLEEGLDDRIARHQLNSAALRAGVSALGLDFLVPESYRLDQITAVNIPDGVDDATVRQRLLREHSIEIGKGFGPFDGSVWRIGLMGESSKAEYLLALLSSLEDILPDEGYEVAQGAAVSAASRRLSEAT
ncbi:MAG: alanine--glyoxylate aminotransferase family protein [Dehalococcoidia bacterium]|nr:alanine--glyoxylate aminotransferase family protein [Dehalococcoidia bacterium]